MRQILNGSTGYYQPYTIVEEVIEKIPQIIMIKTESKPSKMDEIIFKNIKELISKPALNEFDTRRLADLKASLNNRL